MSFRVEIKTQYGHWVLYKRVPTREEAKALRVELSETYRASRIREEN